MKKATVSVFIFSFFLLCSCTAQTAPEKLDINRVFTAEMTLHYNQTAYTADFACNESGCSAVFLSPDEVKGLKIETDGSTVTYSLDGLEFESKTTDGQIIPLNAIWSVITAPVQNAEKTENGFTFYGSTNYGNYVINTVNNYIPNYIELNNEEITVKLSPKT